MSNIWCTLLHQYNLVHSTLLKTSLHMSKSPTTINNMAWTSLDSLVILCYLYISLSNIYIYIIKLFLANLVSSASIRSSKGPGMVSSSLAVQTWIHWIRAPRIHGTHRDTSGRAGLPTKSTLDLHQRYQLESVGISWITWVMSWHVMTSWKHFSQPMITNHQRISKNGMGYDGMH